MAFKLVARNVCIVPVKGVINDDAGKSERFDFTLVCKRMTASALQERMKGGDVSVVDFMGEVTQGWGSVLDETGAAVPFSADGLRELLDTPNLAGLAYLSYLSEQGAKEKN